MKKRFIYLSLLLAVVGAGCSKKQPPAVPAPPTVVSSVATWSEPQFKYVSPDEAKDALQIKQEALEMLTSKDFGALEEFAGKYRASREQFADGLWKLSYVYAGLEVADDDPEEMWQERQGQIHDWIAARPESAMARVAMARLLVNYAWKARGGGWANSVTDEGWRQFGDRLAKASRLLREAARLKDRCPAYWSTSLQMALGMQKERLEYDALFQQAIAEFPDYEGYYSCRSIFLLPRWYGETGELERDLEKSADRVGGEAGDLLYARVVWNVHQYGSSRNVFTENNFSWARANRGFEALLKKFPNSVTAKNEAAHLAMLAGDKVSARRYFEQMNDEIDLSVWNGKNEVAGCYVWSGAVRSLPR